MEELPIDLPTVIRLLNQQSPAIGLAQAKVREAQARLDAAKIQWLPNLSVGIAYNKFDGQTQNQRGDVFGVSRGNFFGGAGPTLTLDLAEAIYRPLYERRMTTMEQFRERAVENTTEFEGISLYLDLVQIYSLLAINQDTLAQAEEMLTAAKNAKGTRLERTAGDVNRAQIEVIQRKVERLDLLGRAIAASSQLGKLLLMPPNVKLIPAEVTVAPITLIAESTTLDQLITTAIQYRPDLAANRAQVAAAWAKVRSQERGPFLPKFSLANQTGAYGGGLNHDLRNFEARNALSLQLFWEFKNLGFGNRLAAAERRAILDQAQFQNIEGQARVLAEIVDAAQAAATRYETLALAQQAVQEAMQLYRINKDGTSNIVDAKNLFDALRPLQAIQALNQARQQYLAATINYNRAQFRLYTQLGNPPGLAVTNPGPRVIR
jgi:outer membrane protein TolC